MQVIGAVIGRQHQHHMIRIVEFRVQHMLLQYPGQLRSGVAEGLGTEGQLQGFLPYQAAFIGT